MHLPDGFLDPATCAATGLVACGAVGYAMRRARQDVGDRLVPLLGVMSAGIFAAQMVNFPIVGGTSGHLVGGVLAAVVLGPWAGLLAMTVVLVVQCLLFYDGGLTALGANVVNMAVAGTVLGYLPYAALRRLVSGPAGHVVGAVVAAWLAVLAGAGLCALELWWSGVYPLHVVLPAMLVVYSFIGVGEALITGLVVAFLVEVRPDLLFAARDTTPRGTRWRHVVAAGMAVALLVAFCLSPLASAAPDGLERVTGELGGAPPAALEAPLAPLADYEFPGLGGVWIATSLAGALGVAAVSIVAWCLARGLRARLAA